MTYYRNFHVYCLVSLYELTNYVRSLKLLQKAQLVLFLANSVYFLHDQCCRLYVGIYRNVLNVLKVVYHQFDFSVSADIVKRVCNKSKEELYEILHRERFTTHCLELESDKANMNLTDLWYKNEEMIVMIETMAVDKQLKMRHEKVMKLMETLDKQWKTRYLFEKTPRGNIVMYYDIFKEGFAYYSDQSYIPYCQLNSAAMKYVTLFKCRDFFVDEGIWKESPLIQRIHRKEEEEKKKKKEAMNQIAHSDVFLRPLQTKTKLKENTVVDMIMNRFIYMGKIQNMLFLQTSKSSTVLPTKRILSWKSFTVSTVSDNDLKVSYLYPGQICADELS